jgi:hypothetical protein
MASPEDEMANGTQETDATREAALLALLRIIGARNHAQALRALEAAPRLATQTVAVGSTRADPRTYYFDAIGHHAYAGDTALHLAAAAHQPELVRELIAMGAGASARNRRGASPLHYAADAMPDSASVVPHAQRSVIALLIEAGADPNALDQSGVAPLHRAVRTRSAAAVTELLERGADPRLRNGRGSTPLHLAVQNTGRGGTGSTEARAQQLEIIRALLEHGARATDQDARGKAVEDSTSAEWILVELRRA